MEVYKHGISFKNPLPGRIPYSDVAPSFIQYATPATRSKGTFSTRTPAWIATEERYHPRGRYDAMRNMPSVDGLEGWRDRLFGKRSQSATRPSGWLANTMAKRSRRMASTNAQPVGQRNAAVLRRIRKLQAGKALGLSGISDLPTYGELSLGEAQAPTAASNTVARSSVTGFLQNLLTTGASLYQTQQEAKVLALRTQVQAGEAALRTGAPTSAMSLPMMLGIGGVALLATTMLLKKKKG